MGWASTFEDIDERRLAAEFERGFDDLVKWVRTHSFQELRREEANLETVARRMVEYIENRKHDAMRAFQEALKIFREPHVQVVSRLAKREKELQELRKKFSTSELNLSRCRAKRDAMQSQCETVHKENAGLKRKINQLEDRLAWFEENVGTARKKR
jgi:chromosome segregation ATPase